MKPDIEKLIRKFDREYCNEHKHENTCSWPDCAVCGMHWLNDHLGDKVAKNEPKELIEYIIATRKKD